MDLLNIWAITVITNYFYRMKTNIETYKAYADLGYIYNNKRLKFTLDNDAENDDDLTWFFHKFGKFIPIYNLFQSLARKFCYCIDAKENIKVFEENGIIEKMTTKEREEYSKKKTGFHALCMRIKLNRKRKKYSMIVLSDNSSILFDYNDDNIARGEDLLNNIKILEARGNLENKSEEQLIKIVYGSHIIASLGILNTYDEPDEFLDNYKENDKVELRLEDKTNQSNLNIDITEEGLPKQEQIKKKIKRR